MHAHIISYYSMLGLGLKFLFVFFACLVLTKTRLFVCLWVSFFVFSVYFLSWLFSYQCNQLLGETVLPDDLVCCYILRFVNVTN